MPRAEGTTTRTPAKKPVKFRDLPKKEQQRRITAAENAHRLTHEKAEAAREFHGLAPRPTKAEKKFDTDLAKGWGGSVGVTRPGAVAPTRETNLPRGRKYKSPKDVPLRDFASFARPSTRGAPSKRVGMEVARAANWATLAPVSREAQQMLARTRGHGLAKQVKDIRTGIPDEPSFATARAWAKRTGRGRRPGLGGIVDDLRGAGDDIVGTARRFDPRQFTSKELKDFGMDRLNDVRALGETFDPRGAGGRIRANRDEIRGDLADSLGIPGPGEGGWGWDLRKNLRAVGDIAEAADTVLRPEDAPGIIKDAATRFGRRVWDAATSGPGPDESEEERRKYWKNRLSGEMGGKRPRSGPKAQAAWDEGRAAAQQPDPVEEIAKTGWEWFGAPTTSKAIREGKLPEGWNVAMIPLEIAGMVPGVGTAGKVAAKFSFQGARAARGIVLGAEAFANARSVEGGMKAARETYAYAIRNNPTSVKRAVKKMAAMAPPSRAALHARIDRMYADNPELGQQMKDSVDAGILKDVRKPKDGAIPSAAEQAKAAEKHFANTAKGMDKIEDARAAGREAAEERGRRVAASGDAPVAKETGLDPKDLDWNTVTNGVDMGVFRQHNVEGLIASLPRLLELGKGGRFWYEESAKLIRAFAGEDKELAAKYTQVVAIMSAQRNPYTNIELATEALRDIQRGRPVKVGTRDQRLKVAEVMSGTPWEGRKTDRFYKNLIEDVDYDRYVKEFHGGEEPPLLSGEVTNDIWQARLFGIQTKVPTEREYAAMEQLTQNIAHALGWKPKQIQAALWGPIRSEGALTKGTSMTVEEGSKHFGDALFRESARLPFEPAPGVETAGQASFDAYRALSPQAQAQFDKEINDAVRSFLRDSGALALLTGRKGMGLYEAQTNPVYLALMPMAMSAKGVQGPSSREAVDTVVAMIGEALKQDASTWFRPKHMKTVPVGKRNGAKVSIGRDLTEDEILKLRDVLEAKLGEGGMVGIPPEPEGGFYILNHSKAVKPKKGQPPIPASKQPNNQKLFQQYVDEALDEVLPGVESQKHHLYFEGNYIERGGKEYEAIKSDWGARPEAQRAFEDLKASVNATHQRHLGLDGPSDPPRRLKGWEMPTDPSVRQGVSVRGPPGQQVFRAMEEPAPETGMREVGQSADPLFDQAVEHVVESGSATASLIQRRLKLGHARASKLLKEMEERGIVSAREGGRRRVLREPAAEAAPVEGAPSPDSLEALKARIADMDPKEKQSLRAKIKRYEKLLLKDTEADGPHTPEEMGRMYKAEVALGIDGPARQAIRSGMDRPFTEAEAARVAKTAGKGRGNKAQAEAARVTKAKAKGYEQNQLELLSPGTVEPAPEIQAGDTLSELRETLRVFGETGKIPTKKDPLTAAGKIATHTDEDRFTEMLIADDAQMLEQVAKVEKAQKPKVVGKKKTTPGQQELDIEGAAKKKAAKDPTKTASGKLRGKPTRMNMALRELDEIDDFDLDREALEAIAQKYKLNADELRDFIEKKRIAGVEPPKPAVSRAKGPRKKPRGRTEVRERPIRNATTRSAEAQRRKPGGSVLNKTTGQRKAAGERPFLRAVDPNARTRPRTHRATSPGRAKVRGQRTVPTTRMVPRMEMEGRSAGTRTVPRKPQIDSPVASDMIRSLDLRWNSHKNLDDQALKDLFDTIRMSDLPVEEKQAAMGGLFDSLAGKMAINKPGQRALIKALGDDGEYIVGKLKASQPRLAHIKRLQYELWQVPRAGLTVLDLSAAGIQALMGMARHPILWQRNFRKMHRAFGDKAMADAMDHAVESHPMYDRAQRTPLGITRGREFDPVTQRTTGSKYEQLAGGTYAERVPTILGGGLIRGSIRAYDSTLNKLRFDIFVDRVEKFEKMGRYDAAIKRFTKGMEGAPPENIARETRRAIEWMDDQVASLANGATGYGTFGKAEGTILIRAMTEVFFSPRYLVARLNTLNPYRYMPELLPGGKPIDNMVRLERVRQAVQTSVLLGGTLYLLDQIDGVDAVWDPYSKDFGKVKFGNHETDIAANLAGHAALAIQIARGQYRDSKGTMHKVGEFGGKTRWDLIEDYGKNKLAPVPGFVFNDLLDTPQGVDKDLKKELYDSVIPIIAQDMRDIVREDGWEGLWLGIPAVYGKSTSIVPEDQRPKESNSNPYGGGGGGGTGWNPYGG